MKHSRSARIADRVQAPTMCILICCPTSNRRQSRERSALAPAPSCSSFEPVCPRSQDCTGGSRLRAGAIDKFGLAIERRLIQQASVNSHVFDTPPQQRRVRSLRFHNASVRDPRTTATLVARTRRYSTRVLLPPCEEMSLQQLGRRISPRCARRDGLLRV